MGFLPKTSGNLQDIHPLAFPPRALLAGLVQLPMMAAAQKHGEFIAHLEANGSGLGKPQVMRIGGLPAADETRLCGDESQVRLVAQPFGFAIASWLLSIRVGGSSAAAGARGGVATAHSLALA